MTHSQKPLPASLNETETFHNLPLGRLGVTTKQLEFPQRKMIQVAKKLWKDVKSGPQQRLWRECMKIRGYVGENGYNVLTRTTQGTLGQGDNRADRNQSALKRGSISGILGLAGRGCGYIDEKGSKV
jgi:hypothetical protein